MWRGSARAPLSASPHAPAWPPPAPSRGRSFQSQLPGARRYTRVAPTLAAIVREEGLGGLYKARRARRSVCLVAACLPPARRLACKHAAAAAQSLPPLHPHPGPQGFVPKALRLGIGQSVGLLTFQRCLRAFGAEHSAADDRAEAAAAALIAD